MAIQDLKVIKNYGTLSNEIYISVVYDWIYKLQPNTAKN